MTQTYGESLTRYADLFEQRLSTWKTCVASSGPEFLKRCSRLQSHRSSLKYAWRLGEQFATERNKIKSAINTGNGEGQ